MQDNIGNKIRKYRKRAGMSQMELEIAIGASAGMISRIENGVVNPNKETLVKIIDLLKLSSFESVLLFDVKVDLKEEFIERFKKILSSSVDINNVCQIAANQIVYEFDYLACFIALINGDRINSIAITQNWASELSLRFVSQKFQSLYVPLDDEDNLMVKCIRNKKCYYTHDLVDIIYPAVNMRVAKIIRKVSKTKAAIAMPLMIQGNVLGSMFLGSESYEEKFEEEMDFLREYTAILAEGVKRVRG